MDKCRKNVAVYLFFCFFKKGSKWQNALRYYTHLTPKSHRKRAQRSNYTSINVKTGESRHVFPTAFVECNAISTKGEPDSRLNGNKRDSVVSTKWHFNVVTEHPERENSRRPRLKPANEGAWGRNGDCK